MFNKHQISKGRIFFRNIYQLCDVSQLCNQDCSSHYNSHSPDSYNLQFTCLNQTLQSLIGGNQVVREHLKFFRLKHSASVLQNVFKNLIDGIILLSSEPKSSPYCSWWSHHPRQGCDYVFGQFRFLNQFITSNIVICV